MTEQEFEARWAHHQELKRNATIAQSDEDKSAAGIFAEAIASGDRMWTQRKIAEMTDYKQGYVCRLLTFQRFLSLMPTGIKLKPTTERDFRDKWDKTEAHTTVKRGKVYEADQQRRFNEVLAMLNADSGDPSSPNSPTQEEPSEEDADMKRRIREACSKLADGKWRLLSRLHAEIQGLIPERTISRDNVRATLAYYKKKCPIPGVLFETKKLENKRGGLVEYRFVPVPEEAFVPVRKMVHFIEGIKPILRELKELGRLHELASSPRAVLHAALRLERLLKPLLEEDTEEEDAAEIKLNIAN